MNKPVDRDIEVVKCKCEYELGPHGYHFPECPHHPENVKRELSLMIDKLAGGALDVEDEDGR